MRSNVADREYRGKRSGILISTLTNLVYDLQKIENFIEVT